MVKAIAIGADHAGFKLKEEIKKYLDKQKIGYIDFGAYKLNKKDDYPNFAFKVAKYVAKNNTKGILICGSGVGMGIAANKVKGVRAAHVHSVKGAKLSRQHDDANVLCMGAMDVKTPLAKRIIGVFLKTKAHSGRHKRRIDKIKRFERLQR